MKILKSLILLLFALIFTGCYTQLQYTSKMKRITDQRDNEGYTQQTESQNRVKTEASDAYDSTNGANEDYLPLYYKDYAYANGWNYDGYPYNVYNNFYGDSFLTLDPGYFYYWHPYRFYGYHRPYFGSRFNFSITFGWGSPYYYNSFFYDPFYDYYWSGYSPFAFNYGYYGGYYGHHGYYNYHGGKGTPPNVHYGPRTIGTNRVENSGDTRSRNSNTVTNRSSNTVSNRSTARARSVGTTRVENTSPRTSSTVTRSRSTSRTRSRGTVRSRSSNNRQHHQSLNSSRGSNNEQPHSVIIRSRNQLNQNPAQSLDNRRSEIRRRLSNQRVSAPRRDVLKRNQHSRPTFFKRLSGFLENTGQAINNSSSYGNRVRIRMPSSSSNSRHSSVSRSSSSSHHSTVSRSHQTSSSHSSSQGSSSRSRGSGGSTRSRGHQH